VNAGEIARATRRGAGLFANPSREVVSVAGSDRVRWLNGMITNDVAALAPGPTRSGCYAVLLTAQGRIVSDLQVLLRPDAFWLDLETASAGVVTERLGKYVIADDVSLERRADAFDRLALEGPAALAIVEVALRRPLALAPDSCAEVAIAGCGVTVAAYGWSGEAALQIFAERGSGADVATALRGAGEAHGLVDANADALEILRIEAGIPRVGAELDETVLPAEARLERAVATTKGCYTGQEVVERLRSQGQVSHLLVGLASDGDEPLVAGAAVECHGKRVGEVTSACVSPQAGSIALGFVRRAHAQTGTAVAIGERSATVAALPFVGGSKVERRR